MQQYEDVLQHGCWISRFLTPTRGDLAPGSRVCFLLPEYTCLDHPLVLVPASRPQADTGRDGKAMVQADLAQFAQDIPELVKKMPWRAGDEI